MKNLLIIIFCSCFIVSGYSQITEAEYFFDTDPGAGNGTSITITPGNTINENVSIPTTGLANGLHVLYIRTKGTNNVWSLYKRAYFNIQEPSTNGTPQNIVAAEYYIDTDNVGVGNQNVLTITPGMAINETFSIPTTGLTEGLHVLHIRVKDADDTWGLYKRAYFYTLVSNSSATATPIVAAEYFFDTDPGVGSATAVTITQGFNIDEDLVIQIPNTMANGNHYLYIRVRDQDGNWSLYKRALFEVDNALSVEDFTSNSFNVFPNPIVNDIHVNFKAPGEYSFSIYDVSGKEVFQKDRLEQVNTFNLSKYAPGVYIFKIKELKANKVEYVKIIKS